MGGKEQRSKYPLPQDLVLWCWGESAGVLPGEVTTVPDSIPGRAFNQVAINCDDIGREGNAKVESHVINSAKGIFGKSGVLHQFIHEREVALSL